MSTGRSRLLRDVRTCPQLLLCAVDVETPSPHITESPRMSPSPDLHAIHQHPLAYLLGLEGVALLRAFAGEYDRDFTHARIQEIRDLLDRADEFGAGADVEVMPTSRGYDGWAARYDGEPNGAFPLQDRVLFPDPRRARVGRGRRRRLRHRTHQP